MSELKAAEQHNAQAADGAGMHEHPVNFQDYLRRCLFVFIAALCAISLMVWISYLPEHYTWAAKAGMILAVASVNAFVVAGFLMHLLTEKKMVYTVLAFTVFFVIGLFVLTICATKDFPTGTTFH
jgi:heme/copper-type cytochrome/quinol oxidase subunit 4